MKRLLFWEDFLFAAWLAGSWSCVSMAFCMVKFGGYGKEIFERYVLVALLLLAPLWAFSMGIRFARLSMKSGANGEK